MSEKGQTYIQVLAGLRVGDPVPVGFRHDEALSEMAREVLRLGERVWELEHRQSMKEAYEE